MIALLSLGVLGFQLVILASMLGAALLGRSWLKGACFVWVAFTLFGSIFTMGLLLLQLATILIGYLLGKGMCDRQEAKARVLKANSHR
mgnify:CR=1 FL=1